MPQVGMVVMVMVHKPLPHQMKVEQFDTPQEIFGTKEWVYCFILRLDARLDTKVLAFIDRLYLIENSD